MRKPTKHPAGSAGIIGEVRSWIERNPLRAYRHDHQLTLAHVAGTIGVSVNTLRNWETGTSSPSARNFERIEQLLRRQIRPLWKAWLNKRPRFQERVA